MADYPSVDIEWDSARIPDSGVQLDVADDGAVRGRDTYTATLYTINAVHRYVTQAERDSIMSHYASHKTVTFNFLYPVDGATYTVNYVNEPVVTEMPGGLFIVASALMGHKV